MKIHKTYEKTDKPIMARVQVRLSHGARWKITDMSTRIGISQSAAINMILDVVLMHDVRALFLEWLMDKDNVTYIETNDVCDGSSEYDPKYNQCYIPAWKYEKVEQVSQLMMSSVSSVVAFMVENAIRGKDLWHTWVDQQLFMGNDA